MTYDEIKAGCRTVQRLIARDDCEAAHALVKHLRQHGATAHDISYNLTDGDRKALRSFLKGEK